MQVVTERRSLGMPCQKHQSLIGVTFKSQGRCSASFLIPPECRCILLDGTGMQRDDEHPSLRGTGPSTLLGVFPRYACRYAAIYLGRSPLNVAQPSIALQGRCRRVGGGEQGLSQMETIRLRERQCRH